MQRLLHIFILLLLLVPVEAVAQYVEQQPNDYYKRSIIWEKKPQDLDYVRETDVYWGRLLWRIIDVREKENQYFYFPESPEGVRGRKNLAYVLWDAIKAGEIELFEDDELKIPLDCQKVIDRATRSDTVQMEVYDDYGEADYTTVFVPHEFKSDDIYQYAIKEAVYLDRSCPYGRSLQSNRWRNRIHGNRHALLGSDAILSSPSSVCTQRNLL